MSGATCGWPFTPDVAPLIRATLAATGFNPIGQTTPISLAFERRRGLDLEPSAQVNAPRKRTERVDCRQGARRLRGLPKIAGRILSKAFAERGVAGIVKWEVLPVADGEKLCVFFEATNSPWRQGIWMRCDRGIEINGETYPSVNLWSHTAPVPTAFTCRTGEGKLHLYNTWDDGNGRRSQSHTSGMRVEELADGWRYRCNDIGFDAAFDKLVFRIQRCE